MKLATLPNGTPDGRLLTVSRDLTRAVAATAIAPSLLQALQHWDALRDRLQLLPERMNA